MEDDPGADDDERAVELSSIAAIFPEMVLDPAQPFDATLDLPVSPSVPLKIHFQALADGVPPDPLPIFPRSDHSAAVDNGTGSVEDDARSLTYFPPLTLRIHLPDGYPSQRPPKVQISTSPPWLPSKIIQALKEDSIRLWEELGRDQVVFTYIDHIQQAAEDAFGLLEAGDGALPIHRDHKIALLDYDIKSQREKFEKETFYCGICLEPKKGRVCHRTLLCSHVFCVSCLQEFYNACITEGEVDNVKCLDPTCGKETAAASRLNLDPSNAAKRKRHDRTLTPSELLQIPLEQETVQRYVQLKRKKRLESDRTTVYCPRQWCQGAARSKKHPKPANFVAEHFDEAFSSEDESPTPIDAKDKPGDKELPPMAERLCICEDCSYAFCSVCKKGWHGELARCDPRKEAELNAEEKASYEYLKLHTTPCPTCEAPCQKTMGCNHMICFKCRTHFCYLCSSYLMEGNPYQHFNDTKSTCYMRLWELEGGDGDQVDQRFRGGNADWADEDTDDDANAGGPGVGRIEDLAVNVEDNGNDSDDNSISSEDTDDLPGRPNWRLDPDQAFHFSDDDDSEDDVWPGLPPRPVDNVAAAQGPRIEIINFAQAGARNPRLIPLPGNPNGQLGNGRNGPHRVPAPPPPHAPVPPRRNNNHGGGNRGPQQPNRRRHQGHRPRAQPENNANGQEGVPEADNLGDEIQADAVANQQMERAPPAPGQGNGAALQPAPLRAMGLERFLELAAQDQEDEWDSDELDDDFDIGVEGDDEEEPPPRGMRQPRVRGWR